MEEFGLIIVNVILNGIAVKVVKDLMLHCFIMVIVLIATLVAKAFITNPKPNVYKYVKYKDGNSANNHWSNLEWCRNQTGSKYGK